VSTAEIRAGKPGPKPGPRDSDLARRFAVAVVTLGSVEKAAEAVGIAERTGWKWKASEWWPEIRQEADEAYLPELQETARTTLYQRVKEDGTLALRVLERLDTRFRPPARQRFVEYTADDTDRMIHTMGRVVEQVIDSESRLNADVRDGLLESIADGWRAGIDPVSAPKVADYM
jgi:hypothetical protein